MLRNDHSNGHGGTREVDVVLVAGARPNFVKVAPLHRAIREQGRLRQLLLHTGQHHDEEMSRVFFEELELPTPDVYLGASSGTHAQQTGRIMVLFEQFLTEIRPRMVLVVGDVNSTLACSVVAAKSGVPIAHVEAGLRSFDRSMPEEINRVVTDALADVLYTTCDDGTTNLIAEGIMPERILQTGNVMIDTLLRYKDRAAARPLPIAGSLADGGYALATLHRPANVDRAASLRRIVEILEDTAERLPVVFPVHPRTRNSLEEQGMTARLAAAGVHLLPPQGYTEFLRLMLGAALVLTDSGGVQEETTVLGIPCLTLRDNTERPVTERLGTNVVVGLERPRIAAAVADALAGRWQRGAVPPGWDGHAAERIAAHLADLLLDPVACFAGEPELLRVAHA